MQKHRQNVDFIKFRDIVTKQMTGSACDVRRELGSALRGVPRFPTGKATIHKSEWEDWLHEVDLPKNTPDEYGWYGDDGSLRDISNFVSTLASRGSGSKEFSAALYYRLHYHIERPELAERVDKVAFDGNTFAEENDGVPVFDKLEGQEGRFPPSTPPRIKLDDTYQYGREEFVAAKAALQFDEENSVALTAAVHGAGGYGKTAIAEEICLNEEIRSAFSGGIYWLQFGMIQNKDKTNTSFISPEIAVDQMLRRQYGQDIKITKKIDTLEALLEILPKDRLLIIVDDAWNSTQAAFANNPPDHVAVLTTTRNAQVISAAHHQIKIDRLSPEAAFKLLSDGMDEVSVEMETRLKKIADGLGGWPLLLKLANGLFNGSRRVDLEKVVQRYEGFLEENDILSWDIVGNEDGDAQEKRRRLVGCCLQAGLDALRNNNERELLESLAVFPDDTDIPFDTVMRYWAEKTRGKIGSEQVNPSKALRLLESFNDYSFFRDFDEDNKTLKIHDEVLRYFRLCHFPEKLTELHDVMVSAFEVSCGGDWSNIPQVDQYAWKHLLYHMEQAGQIDCANALRTNFPWLRAKLHAVGVSELYTSYLSDRVDHDARRVGRAIGVSASTLRQYPLALAHQLYGRLGHEIQGRIEELIARVKASDDFWPRPVKPHLFPLGREIFRLDGHNSRLNSAAFSRDGLRIVTASEDGTARIWDGITGTPIGDPLQGHDLSITSIIFSPSGKQIFTASYDDTLRAWDSNTGAPIGEPLKKHDGWLSKATFSPDGTRIVTQSCNNTLHIWDSKSGDPIGESLKEINQSISFAAFSHDGTRIVMVLYDCTAQILDSRTGVFIGEPLKGHRDSINSAAFSPDGTQILTTSSDGSARIWDGNTGTPVGEPFKGRGASVTSAAFSPDGTQIVTASRDGLARIWDGNTGFSIGEPFRAHRSWFNSVVFNPEGTQILTASNDGKAQVWDCSNAGPADNGFNCNNHSISCAAFSTDRRRIVTASYDCIARICDSTTGILVGEPLKGHSSSITSAAFSPDGAQIVTVSHDMTARIWDSNTGSPIGYPLKGHSQSVKSAYFSLDGARIVTTSFDDTARIWDSRTGASIGEPLKGHSHTVTDAAFSLDGTRVFTASYDMTVRIWDSVTGSPIGTSLEGHNSGISSFEISPDGTRIITRSQDKTARIWDSTTGALIGKPMEGHDDRLSTATFSPNGTQILTTSSDGSARIWDGNTGTPVGEPFKGRGASVTSAAFNPHGTHIVLASSDCTASIWNLKTSLQISTINFDVSVFALDWSKEALFFIFSDNSVCKFYEKPIII